MTVRPERMCHLRPMYTEVMRDLIQLVERTRPDRVGKHFSPMSPSERQQLLESHHPDYTREAFETLVVGKCKGQRAPRDLVTVLQSGSPLADGKSDLSLAEPDYDVDVLIVGGGGAGASAALAAFREGADVLLTTKLRLGDSNTVMAQGGVQAATLPHDSPVMHYLDVIGGGHFSNDPALVRCLVDDAPGIIRWLEKLGVIFDKKTDGTLMPVHGGGTSRQRMHAARDYSGLEIMRVLRDEVGNQGIECVEFSPAVELLLDGEGRAAGAVLHNLDTGTYLVARARTVVLACGGSGRLHYQGFPTTNHYGATGDGLVMAYRAGAELKFLDTMQYHPTGVAYPPQIEGLLVTEKLRGMGAMPLNVRGEMFVYHLETRDVEASAIIRECRERNLGVKTPTGMVGVWLDTALVETIHGQGVLERSFPAMLRQFLRFGIDIRKDPVLVYPTLHYQNGGIAIDPQGRTGVENLFAAGENTGGVHGRNRLAGNSLLDILVYGQRAGASAARQAREVQGNRGLTLNHAQSFHQELEKAGIDPEQRTSPVLFPYRAGAEVPTGTTQDTGGS